jgi:hypothetical protein
MPGENRESSAGSLEAAVGSQGSINSGASCLKGAPSAAAVTMVARVWGACLGGGTRWSGNGVLRQHAIPQKVCSC